MDIGRVNPENAELGVDVTPKMYTLWVDGSMVGPTHAPEGATPMNAYLTERAIEIDRQLKAATTTEERRAAIAARKAIRGALERLATDKAEAK
jgi:hypothetical protein